MNTCKSKCSEHWPRVFSSAHGRSCSPGRRASRPQLGTVGPQTAFRSVDTASWGWRNAAPQRPSQRRTSFSLQLWHRETQQKERDRVGEGRHGSTDTVQGPLAPVNTGDVLSTFCYRNACACMIFKCSRTFELKAFYGIQTPMKCLGNTLCHLKLSVHLLYNNTWGKDSTGQNTIRYIPAEHYERCHHDSVLVLKLNPGWNETARFYPSQRL